jgi:hypothetical protein
MGEISISDALALAEQVHGERGLMLGLYGPTGGFWYAQFLDPLHPAPDALLRYESAPTCAEAIRLAAEQIAEVSSDAV